MTKPLISAKQVAEHLSVHVDTVYDMINRGQIPAIKIGNRWRVAEQDLPQPYRVSIDEPRSRAPRPVTGHFRLLARDMIVKDAS